MSSIIYASDSRPLIALLMVTLKDRPDRKPGVSTTAIAHRPVRIFSSLFCCVRCMMAYAAEGSPRKERQTEAHNRGVKPEKLIFELEFVLRGKLGWQPRYIRPNSASKKQAGRRLLASAKVERATGLTPRR